MTTRPTILSSHPPRQLGATGPTVFPIALGCMGMSGMYGAADESQSIATIYAALERGVNLLDTGDFDGSGHNEMLIGRALRGRRDRAFLSVKFGALRTPDGGWNGIDGRPQAVKSFAAYSEQLTESLAALEARLTADTMARVDAVLGEYQVAGTRYDSGQMRMLDSERSETGRAHP